jgi:hypothetical protein
MFPARIAPPRASRHVRSNFRTGRRVPISRAVNTMACRAVARAGTSAATASLDDGAAWPLLLVAGWLTTAAELQLEAQARAALDRVPV